MICLQRVFSLSRIVLFQTSTLSAIPLLLLQLQLRDTIYRLRFCSNSLIQILSLSNSYNSVASVQKNRNDKSHLVIVALRRISCHGRNHSQASCEYSLTIFLCCQRHSEYSLLGSKFSTNLLFAASKCHVTIQRRGSSRCSKWPNRMGWLQW